MTAVGPLFASSDHLPRPVAKHDRLKAAFGAIYVIMSVAFSFQFVLIMEDSATNDYYWPGFNTSGIQAFLSDMYNRQQSTLSAVEQLDQTMAIYKDYSGSNTFVGVNPSKGRSVLLGNISLELAIIAVRGLPFGAFLDMASPYCWVDFNRSFELALTATRQRRCILRDVANAAVYLESILRNCDSQTVTSSFVFPFMNSSIFSAMQRFPGGNEWVESIFSRNWLSQSDELKAWHNAGFSYWKTQLTNAHQASVDESLVIINALGIRQTIKTGRTTYLVTPNGGTTKKAYWGFANGLQACGLMLGCTLVRSDMLHFEKLGIDWDIMLVMGGLPPTPSIDLVRTYIGPFGVIDIRSVVVPKSLLNLVTRFQQEYISKLLADTSKLELYNAIKLVQADPIPSHWQNQSFSFYGGSPMCVLGAKQSFIQQSFNLYDDCQHQIPFTIPMDRDTTLFALYSMGGVIKSDFVCSLCQATRQACQTVLSNVKTLYPQLSGIKVAPSDMDSIWSDVAAVNISFVQFATDVAFSNKLLHQSLFLNRSDPWSFYGWIEVFEWAQGLREVYTFEGDHGSLTLISPTYSFVDMEVNPLELPRNACKYINYISVYVSFILACIGAIVALLALLEKYVIPVNIFQFNRVTGSVWVGRPFLLIRGMTAGIILSTANVAFQSVGGFARLKFQRRSWFEICLLSGEATWLLYSLLDICLPFIRRHAKAIAPISCFVSWLVILTVEAVSPIKPTASLENKCTIIGIDLNLFCDRGTFEIGSPTRLIWICVIQLISALVVFILVRWILSRYLLNESENKSLCNLLVPSASEAFLIGTEIDSDLVFDKIACVLSGMIPLPKYVFDMKLWEIVPLPSSKSRTAFPKPQFRRTSSIMQLSGKIPYRRRYMPCIALLGLVYIGATITGSYLYLGLTASTMANDFWWTSFNSTGTQAFLSYWFMKYLQTTDSIAAAQLNFPRFGDADAAYNLNTSFLIVSTLYASGIQDEANSLYNVIQGLRQMRNLQQPWIFTSYCFVDFKRQWEMANSVEKQRRCSAQYSNAAIYLESILRNGDWSDTEWKSYLEIGVLSHLRTSVIGNNWIQESMSVLNSINDEVKYWQANNLSSFRTQWQNYKTIGVLEDFSVRNAFGIDYAITLKHTNYTFQKEKQISFKMYWSFANDLLAVGLNQSSLGGRSLVRSSGHFAFQNSSIENGLIETGYLPSPLNTGLALARSILGPFGSTDVYRVTCPQSLRLLYQTLTEELTVSMASDDSTWSSYSKISAFSFYIPQPSAWNRAIFVSGNIFCEINSPGAPIPLQHFTIENSCETIPQAASIIVNSKLQIKAIVAANLLQDVAPSSLSICAFDVSNPVGCVATLDALRALVSSVKFYSAQSLSQAAKNEIVTLIKPELVQFIRNSPVGEVNLSRVPIFQEDPSFDYFSWLYLFDWANGFREVITLQGTNGQLTTISGFVGPLQVAANSMEIPVNVATYMRLAIQYVTIILILVGSLTAFHLLAACGYVECWNMLQINRLAGAIWIGRPLIFLRGVTALCLLSTSNLDLTLSSNGMVTYFESPSQLWITTIMSCGEMSWLIYILNDIFSPVTKDYTASYSTKSAILGWLAAVVWSFASPTKHQATIKRECSVESVDFQIVCHSGRVEIGSFQRFIGLISLAAASCLVAYIFERLTKPKKKRRHQIRSYFLHTVAKNSLAFDIWNYDGVYYLDKASALLNGLLTAHCGKTLYVFDMKTWRFFTFEWTGLDHSECHRSLTLAIPLLE
ncbi:hypothetical protein LEN26_012553 [Aphanomyces euteiches]|nr:hypothetical protein AeMF1_015016 [Aphanomyces euteiches]KAH9117624.1 hypothetical protein LEN26_012553 [Aphanomyces euteiches]